MLPASFHGRQNPHPADFKIAPSTHEQWELLPSPQFCWQSIVDLVAFWSALQIIWIHEAVWKCKNKQDKFSIVFYACIEHHCKNNNFLSSSSILPRGNLQSVKDFPLILLSMPLYWFLHQYCSSELLHMQHKAESSLWLYFSDKGTCSRLADLDTNENWKKGQRRSSALC